MKKFMVVFLVLSMLTLPVVLAEATDPAPALRIDLTQIILAFISLLGALLTNKLIPWLEAQTDEKEQRILSAAVTTAVYAAEQMYGALQGKEKLMYVKGQLAKKGYAVDIDEIEAAVREMNLQQLWAVEGELIVDETPADATQDATQGQVMPLQH